MTSADEPGAGGSMPLLGARRAVLKRIGSLVGVLLLGAAVWAVRGQWGSVEHAVEASGGQWGLLAIAAGLPLLNWLLTAGVFYFLVRAPTCRGECYQGPTDSVSPGEMTLLIGSAWLLNYLPLSPGMFGRVAYHKSVHRIPVTVSVRALIEAILLGVGIVGVILAAVVVAGPGTSEATYRIMLGAPPAGLILLAWVGWWVGRCRGGWRYAAAAAMRWLDVLVWMARYAVVFRLLGRTLTLAETAAVAAASQAAMQVPLVGNGLGVREWAVGLVGPVLPSWMGAAAGGLTRGLGLSADLLNRGAEVVVALPVGIVCTAILAGKQGLGPLAFRSQAKGEPTGH